MNRNITALNQKQKISRLLPKILLNSIPNLLNPLAKLFAHLKISPNTISTFSLIAGFAAGIFFAFELHLLALISILLSGVFDTLDGKVAVRENKQSLYGAIYDSTLDRYAEFFIYLGIAIYFRNHWALWITFVAILGSFMVSYTRARAEGLGIECNIGFMQRAERLVTLILATLLGIIFHVFDYVMIAALCLIAVISNFTALQRTLYVRRIEKPKKLR